MVSLKEKPFLFLIGVLASSEIFLFAWLIVIDPDSGNAFYERIVVGALSITILIAVLVISCIIYWIKTYSEMETNKMKHDLGNHGIGTNSEREKITSEWPAELLYYDTDDQKWYYISKNDRTKQVNWIEVVYSGNKEK